MGPTWPLKYKYGDRLCIIGPSGSGKTVLLKTLARQKRNVVVIDTKADKKENWDRVGLPTKNLFGLRGGRYVWTATPDFITNAADQSRTYEALLASGPRVVAIDEAYSTLPTRGLKLMATQGRGKEVSFLIGMQRPTGAPLYLLTDANFWFIFGLKLKDDRKRVEQAVGDSIDWDTLNREEFSFLIFDARGKSSGPYRLPPP
jgi:GTPase SAR1 family protein